MMTPLSDMALRPFEPADAPALATLFEHTPDAGQISFTTRFATDAYTALTALHADTAGVIALLPDTGRIIGVALVDLSQRQIEDDVRPCAPLHTLKVHPDVRRRGIARHLAQWRIDYARQRLGDNAVILADIQKHNTASERAARHWANQFVGQPRTALVRMREKPPTLPGGITVRSATSEELAEVAEQQNRFYQAYNLYAPQTAASLTSWRTRTPFGSPIRDIVVTVDAGGAVLAGVRVTERGRLLALHVGQLPQAMQLVNRAIRLLPADGIVQEVVVDGVWFRPDQVDAACTLWEWLRWAWRARGSALRVAYDPRGSLPGVFRLPAWWPQAQSTFAVWSPTSLRSARLLDPFS